MLEEEAVARPGIKRPHRTEGRQVRCLCTCVWLAEGEGSGSQVQWDPWAEAGTSWRVLRWGRVAHTLFPPSSMWGARPSLTPASFSADIRLRVRAEYCEHGPALEQGVASRRPQALARQLDVFGQATAVLRSRDLGSVVCDIKFSELSYLDAFWGDYLSGALLQALRGVFLTEALREAVGREAVRLLVSVDEADYEAGRRRLLLMEEGGRRPSEAS